MINIDLLTRFENEINVLDGVRGGFANAFSTGNKYEINPEEIKVNFGDVRGVSQSTIDRFFSCSKR